MAAIHQILPRFWPGNRWSMSEDDYSTLEWNPGNSIPKPSEAEIRARSDETDALIAADGRLTRQQRAMIDAPDYLLKAFEIIIDALAEIRRVTNLHNPQTPWDQDIINRVIAMKNKIAQLREIQ